MANVKITELPAVTSVATTDILPVVTDPGGSPVTDKITVQNFANSLHIPAANIVASYAVSTFTNNADGSQGTNSIVEIGQTINNFTFVWTYNRNSSDPASQSINNGVGSVTTSLRTKAVTAQALTSDTTYTLSGIGDDTTAFTANSAVLFQAKRYFGVSQSILTTGASMLTLSSEFATSKVVSKTFDASVGGGANYLYISYPTSFGAPVNVKFNGFDFTDYDLSTVSLTNASGHTQNYYILRTNPTYSGASVTLAITS